MLFDNSHISQNYYPALIRLIITISALGPLLVIKRVESTKGKVEDKIMNSGLKIRVGILVVAICFLIPFLSAQAGQVELTHKPCPTCLTLNKISSKFCISCGFKFEIEDAEPVVTLPVHEHVATSLEVVDDSEAPNLYKLSRAELSQISKPSGS